MIEFAPLSFQLQYDEALLYIITCTYDNKYDWRIPTEQEIKDFLLIYPLYAEINVEYMIFINAKFQTFPVRTIDA